MTSAMPQNVANTTDILLEYKKKGQLAQYMEQYKNNPYMMSLAASVNAMYDKAQVRDAAPQATVADQTLAKMGPAKAPMPQGQPQAMPEDSGIGALPQQPMGKAMAGGGIVAFAGNEDSLVKDDSQMSVFDKLLKANADYRSNTGKSLTEAGRESQREQIRNMFGLTPSALQPAVESDYSDKANALNEAGLAGTTVTPSNLGADMSAYSKAPGTVQTSPKTPTVSPLANLGGAPRAPAAPAGLSFIEQQKKTLAAMGPEVNPEQAAMEKLIAERNKGAETGKAEFEADVKARADQFKGREERIGKRELALGKEKDTNTGLAFLQAGLSMMQARGPALAAIAEGAGVGTKQYASGLKDLKAAQLELDKARDLTDELKQNQSMMDAKERRGLSKDIRDASLTGQQYMIDARAKIHGEARADARAATVSDIAVQQSALDRQNRIQVAGMPGDQQKMLTALGGKGGLEAGLTKMQEIQADKTGAAYAKLFTETVAEANKTGATPPTATQFAASLRQLAAAMNPGKVPGAVDATGASRS